MRILITSGTGMVAKELINHLLRLKLRPVVMSHSPEKLKDLPPEVEGVYGDLSRPETWEDVFENIDKLCLITPAMLHEGTAGVAFAEKAHAKGIKNIVFLGIHNVMTAPTIPHFEAKIRIKNYLINSGRPFTVIEPNNFYQNDSWFIPAAKASGHYLQPLGEIGLNRIDARDISLAMANALHTESHYFKSYPLVGPETLSGSKIARILSETLNQEITYPQDCLEKWETFIQPHIPSWLLEDWRMMYKHFCSQGLRADSLDFINQEKILGQVPRKYEDYIKENL